MTEEIDLKDSSSSIYYGEDLPVMATDWFIWEMSGHRKAPEYEAAGQDSGRRSKDER